MNRNRPKRQTKAAKLAAYISRRHPDWSPEKCWALARLRLMRNTLLAQTKPPPKHPSPTLQLGLDF